MAEAAAAVVVDASSALLVVVFVSIGAVTGINIVQAVVLAVDVVG